jgi:hypothetical protein
MFEAQEISGFKFEPGLTDLVRPPFRGFEFSTTLSPTHATRILREIVEPPRKWRMRTSSKRGFFEGIVSDNRFKVHRIIRYQESFRPIIEGHFRSNGHGTTVIVTMRLAWIVMLLWSAVLLFLFWSSVSVDSQIAQSFNTRVALLAMTLFMYLVPSVCFAIEARVAMKRLLEALRSRPTLVRSQTLSS